MAPPPLPVSYFPCDTLLSHGSTTDTTDQPKRTALRPPRPLSPPDCDAESARNLVAPPKAEGPAAGIQKGKTDWALSRYRSGSSSFPDYGKPADRTGNMKSIKAIGNFITGNRLNNSSPSQGQQPSPTPGKRPGSSGFAQPAKRPRITNTDVISLDGSSDVAEPRSQSVANSSQTKMGLNDSQSQRSTRDDLPKAPAVDSLRDTLKIAQGGRRNDRSRHKKDHQPILNGRRGQKRESDGSGHSAPGPPLKRKLLSQRREVPEDAIVDLDEDDEGKANGGTSSGKINRNKAATYTTSKFLFPLAVCSDDELNQEPPPPPPKKLRDAMRTTGNPNVSRTNHANSSAKRSTSGSPDELQLLNEPPITRPSEPSNQGDIPRSKLSPATRRQTDRVRLLGAVCPREFIYPAPEVMPHNAQGATNKDCYLLVPTNDSSGAWQAVDKEGSPIPELSWLTPKLSKINHMASNPGSRIVRHKKPFDFSANFATGAALWIEFATTADSLMYLDGCLKSGNGIPCQDLASDVLQNEFSQKSSEVRKYCMQIAERETSGANQRVPAGSISATSERNRPGHFQETKIQQAQKRAGGEPSSMPSVKTMSRTPQTAREQRQLREVVDSDDDEHHHAQTQALGKQRQRISSLQDPIEVPSLITRRTRAAKAKPLSPTPPPPERWTSIFANWVAEHNYKIPLIYERTTINTNDIERLDEGQFLNDEIISFYAKYLHKQLERENADFAKKVYVFSSFFWEKLRSSGYSGVQSWTAKVDLSSFDYIVVPINQSAHWYVAIICNPGALLPRGQSDADQGDADQGDANQQSGDRQGNTVHAVADENPGEVEVSVVSEASPKVDTVTTSFSRVSIGDQLDGPAPVDIDNLVSAKTKAKKTKTKRGPAPRKYDRDAPRIIVLDSLGSTHSDVTNTLKNYLIKEFENKKAVDIEIPRPFGMPAKDIPFQDNFTDCGVYLLGYLEEFMKDPYVFTGNILQHEARTWDINASDLRTKIRNLIFELQSKYQKDHNDMRRKAREQKTLSHTPPSGSRPSSSRGASDQPAFKSSAASSPAPSSRRQTPQRVLPSEQPAPKSVATRSPMISSRRQTPQRVLPSEQPAPKSVATRSPTTSSCRQIPENNLVRTSPGCLSRMQASSRRTPTGSPPHTQLDRREPSQGPNDDVKPGGADNIAVVDSSDGVKSSGAVSSKPQLATKPNATNPNMVIASSSALQSESEPPDTNTSMLVNCNLSFDSRPDQNVEDEDLTPRPHELVKSVEVAETHQPNSLSSSRSPRPLEPPQRPERSTHYDGNIDERDFLKPLKSSPPNSSAPRQSSATPRAASQGRNDRGHSISAKRQARNAAPKQDTKNRHSASEKQPPGRSEGFRYSGLPSSSAEDEKGAPQNKVAVQEERSHQKKKKDDGKALIRDKRVGRDKPGTSSPIDLTSD